MVIQMVKSFFNKLHILYKLAGCIDKIIYNDNNDTTYIKYKGSIAEHYPNVKIEVIENTYISKADETHINPKIPTALAKYHIADQNSTQLVNDTIDSVIQENIKQITHNKCTCDNCSTNMNYYQRKKHGRK